MSVSNSGFSLVKYDTPILVSKTFGKGAKGGASSANSSAKTSASSLSSGDAAAN